MFKNIHKTAMAHILNGEKLDAFLLRVKVMKGYAFSLLFNFILEILIIIGQEQGIKVYSFFFLRSKTCVMCR